VKILEILDWLAQRMNGWSAEQSEFYKRFPDYCFKHRERLSFPPPGVLSRPICHSCESERRSVVIESQLKRDVEARNFRRSSVAQK
jgi:hypothetical protein